MNNTDPIACRKYTVKTFSLESLLSAPAKLWSRYEKGRREYRLNQGYSWAASKLIYCRRREGPLATGKLVSSLLEEVSNFREGDGFNIGVELAIEDFKNGTLDYDKF